MNSYSCIHSKHIIQAQEYLYNPQSQHKKQSIMNIPDSLNIRKSAQTNSFPTKPISGEQSARLFKQMETMKYPIPPISQPQELQTKIKSFKEKQIQNHLQKMLVHCNSYRQVRGDGNCFFRAIGFAFLSHLQKSQVKECFPQLSQIQLTSCKPESIPKSFRQFYDHRFLKDSLKTNWNSQLSYRAQRYGGNYSRALARLLTDYPYLDFIMILYFRAVCLKAFKDYKKQYKQYLQGDQQDSIGTYGEESEGVILDICNQLFKISIEVFQIRKKQVKAYKYHKLKNHFCQVSLLYFQNHYDLIEKASQSQIKAEKSQVRKHTEKNMDVQFFTEISGNTLQGTCIQCSKDGLIFQESGLCKACHDMSMNNLMNYTKDKLITAVCAQCRYKCRDVSQQFGLCKDCIKQQSNYTQKKKYQTNYCQTCHDQVKEPGKCYKCKKGETHRMGKCLQCKYTQRISIELGICDFCARAQQKYADKIIERIKIKNCSTCNQELQSGKDHKCKQKTCQGCLNKTPVLNQLKLCRKCSEFTKDDTVQSSIRRQAAQKQRNDLAKTMPSGMAMGVGVGPVGGVATGMNKNKDAQKFKITQSKIGDNVCNLCHRKVRDDQMRGQTCQNCYARNKEQQERQNKQEKLEKQGKAKVAQSSINTFTFTKKQQQKGSISNVRSSNSFETCKKCGKQQHKDDIIQGKCRACQYKIQIEPPVEKTLTCKYCKKDSKKHVIRDGVCLNCKQYR